MAKGPWSLLLVSLQSPIRNPISTGWLRGGGRRGWHPTSRLPPGGKILPAPPHAQEGSLTARPQPSQRPRRLQPSTLQQPLLLSSTKITPRHEPRDPCPRTLPAGGPPLLKLPLPFGSHKQDILRWGLWSHVTDERTHLLRLREVTRLMSGRVRPANLTDSSVEFCSRESGRAAVTGIAEVLLQR